MRLTFAFFVISAVCLSGATSRAETSAAEKTWIEEFQRYSAQSNLLPEYSFTGQRDPAQKIWLADVLRKLPEPKSWPHLRDAVGEAARATQEGPLKKRLEAGKWLLNYLLGERVLLRQEVSAIAPPEDVETNDAESYFARRLLNSLSTEKYEGRSPQMELKAFEQTLLSLEPLDEAKVTAAIGGAENLRRARHLFAGEREFYAQVEAVTTEAEKSPDAIDSEAKIEALNQGFAKEYDADRKALEPFLKNPTVALFLSQLSGRRETGLAEIRPLYVPDLVAIVGAEAAEKFLQRALRLPVTLSVAREVSAPTRRLAANLALESIGMRTAPDWGLVKNEDGWRLFEAVRNRFPSIDPRADGYGDAWGFYLEHLIGDGRVEEAVKLVVTRPMSEGQSLQSGMAYDAITRLEQSHPENLWTFWRGWLAAKPAADDWVYFNRLSAQLDRREAVKSLIADLARADGFRGLDGLSVELLQSKAELATGDLEHAVTRMRTALSLTADTPQEGIVQWVIGGRLLEIATLQNDHALHEAALAAMETRLEKEAREPAGPQPNHASELAGYLNESGHFSDALRVSRAMMASVAQSDQDAAEKISPIRRKIEWSEPTLQNLLGEELRALVELKRWQDAQELLQKNPYWGAKDVVELLHDRVSSNQVPLVYYVARVIEGKGDQERGRRVLEAQLVATPTVDTVYARYVEVAGKAALPFLEKLFAEDRYEERPLIWKGRVQFDAGDWDAATATFEQAVQIDPSDGEQGRGDRMRVYTFLSQAMAAKGKREQATFLANGVKAIRIAETADRWFGLGAYARAAELYREALGFFSDAYCIQSRLAIRLADKGALDEATEHYQRAFELMPESFGRVESHCFGCEHVFGTEKSQQIAADVFARLLRAQPRKPQLHYLSGYLHEEEKKYAEAADNYREAVRLDPLYLNAWSRLAGLAEQLKFTAIERDRLILKLAELDPIGRHVDPELAKVNDLPLLWSVLAENQTKLTVHPTATTLLRLEASAKRMESSPQRSIASGTKRVKDGAAVLLEHRFVEAWQEYMTSLSNEPIGP